MFVYTFNKWFQSKKVFLILFLILIICTPVAFQSLKSNIVESIPEENPEEEAKLKRVISLSKYDPEAAINQLIDLKGLSEYTNYKKNYILARLLEEKGDYKQSLEIYKELINKNYPLKERVFFHYADLNTKSGKDIEAQKYFNKLIQEFPNSKSIPQTKYYLAQTLMRLQYKTQALNLFKALSMEFANSQYGIASNYYLGENTYYKKNLGVALNYFRNYLKESPDGRFSKEIVSLLLKDDLKNLITKEDYILIGDVYFFEDDFKTAANYYLLAGKQNKEALYRIGYSLFRSNKGKESIDYFFEYAKTFPKLKNARFALYYAALSTPFKNLFWQKVKKEIPELAYYASYKEGQIENNNSKKKKILLKFLEDYPQNIFTLEATWDLMWIDIKNKDYKSAYNIGLKQFELSKKSRYKNSDTRAKVGFWLGKIAEKQGATGDAINFYTESSELIFDDYYAHRSRHRLNELTSNGESESKDPKWKLVNNLSKYQNQYWAIPQIIHSGSLRKIYGSAVSELINLEQYNEAIELIGKSYSPSKRINSWIKALNEEYLESINLSNEITNKYSPEKSNPLFKLSYPMYYFSYVIKACEKYPSLDPMIVFAIIRQESRFDHKAISVSDAHGLMQLIPPTAKSVASRLGIPLPSIELLNNPEINIQLGANYINGLINELNSPLLAVAGYNAGPGASKRWINTYPTEDMDIFIEHIPYSQTRDYVKKVFNGYWTYTSLYGS